MNRIITSEHRLDLVFNLNHARFLDEQCAENNESWNSNGYPVGSQEWEAWCAGFKATLERLAAQELERREREAKRREVAQHVAEVQRRVSEPSWFDRFLAKFFEGRKA